MKSQTIFDLELQQSRCTEPRAKLAGLESFVTDKSKSMDYQKREDITKIHSQCGRYIYHFSLVDYLN